MSSYIWWLLGYEEDEEYEAEEKQKRLRNDVLNEIKKNKKLENIPITKPVIKPVEPVEKPHIDKVIQMNRRMIREHRRKNRIPMAV